jgi:hypothetical protein
VPGPASHSTQAAPLAAPPTAEEAAAIAAALERFAHETAPPPAGPAETPDPWTRAAMLEGVMREDRADVPHPWINT